jgi:hypothetical protein
VPNSFGNLWAFYAARQILPSGRNDRVSLSARQKLTRQFLPVSPIHPEKIARQNVPGIVKQDLRSVYDHDHPRIVIAT